MRSRSAVVLTVLAVALLRSIPASATWRAIGPAGGNVAALAITSANTWYVSNETYRGSAVYRSRDDGATWRGLGEIAIFDAELFVDRTTEPDTVLAWGDGIQRLVDGDDRWKRSSFRTSSGDEVSYLYVSSMARLGDGVAATLVLSSDEGVFASTDHGASWIAVESVPATISTLAVDPNASPPRVIAAAADGTIVASSDLVTWSIVGHVPVFSAPGGAPVVYGLAVEGGSPVSRLYASIREGDRFVVRATDLFGDALGGWTQVDWSGAQSIGLFTTDDGGDLMLQVCSSDGCQLLRPGSERALEDVGERLPAYVGAVSLARGLPVVAGGCAGVLALSADGRWTPRSGNLSVRGIDAVALDDRGVPDVIYAMDSSCGKLFRSTDDGASWTALGNDLDFDGGLLLDRSLSPARVYVTTYGALYASDDRGDSFRYVLEVGWLPAIDTTTSPATLFVDSGVSLFRSSDDGRSWESWPAPWAGTQREPVISTLAVDTRTRPVRLLAATEYGLHVSTDAGVTWQYANRGLAERDEPDGTELWVYVYDVVVPSRPRDLTLLVTDDGIYTSRGNGPTWKRERSGLVSVIDDEIVEFEVASSGRTTLAGGDDGRLYVRDRKKRQWRWINRGLHRDFGSILSLALGTSRAPRILVGTYGAGVFDRPGGVR